MAPLTTHLCDEGGDTVLTLETTRRAFVWSDDELRLVALPNAAGKKQNESEVEVVAKKPPDGAQGVPADSMPEEALVEPANENEAVEEVLSGHQAQKDPHGSGESAESADQKVKLRIRASSRHLILASPVFRDMLTGPFAEGIADDRGLYQISASEWDPEALVILFNIIHGRHRDVPRSLSLEMLSKIAIIVDYYRCHEIVEVFSDMWLSAIERAIPAAYGEESMLWLLVSWVFSQEDTFQTMARLALRHSQGPITATELPIPPDVLVKIDDVRQAVLDEVFSALYLLYDNLCHESVCSFECSAMRLGCLTKELTKHQILIPAAEKPYIGYSMDNVKTMINGFQSPRWCNMAGSDRHRAGYYNNYGNYCSAHGCSIIDKLGPAMESAEQQLCAVKLGDFSSPSYKRRDGLTIG